MIYIIEDDENIRNLVQVALNGSGYETAAFETAEEALGAFKVKAPQLAIFDLMLPGMDGLEVLGKLRSEKNNVPILLLTAKSEVEDRVKGLDAGADDYVTKPFGMMELISRIKAVLRRSANGNISSEDTFEIGEIRLDPKKHEVTVHGEVVNLTLKEYELLKRLMKNSNIVLTRDQLLEDIWGYDFDGETRTVDVHVRTLRQKLGDAGEQIETVRGVGYRMSR